MDDQWDGVTSRETFAAPGMDTRQWFSIGWVQPDTADAHSVMFNDTDGNPLPNGVMVMVKLEPSGYIVPCLVGSQVSGVGEAEYHPMGPGDIVYVGIPQGDERAGCVILSRISMAQDTFPQTVAGMDVTQNNVNFKRIALPYIIETATSYMVRQGTGASWSIDPAGNVIFHDSNGNVMSMNPDAVTIQEGSGTALLQIDAAKFTTTIASGGTSILVDDYGSSGFGGVTITTGGGVQIVTGTGLPIFDAPGHAMTCEQVVALLANFVIALNSLSAFAPTFTTAFAAGFPGTLTAIMTPLLQGAASVVAATPLLPGALAAGGVVLAPLILSALQTQIPDPTGVITGLARKNLLL